MSKRVNMIIGVKQLNMSENYTVIRLIHLQLTMLEMGFEVENLIDQSLSLSFKLTSLHYVKNF